MNKKFAKKFILDCMDSCGITLNGNNPWDIHINNEEFYSRVLRYGSLGLGESYMEGWWDCQHIDQFMDRVIKAKIENIITGSKMLMFKLMLLKFINIQTKEKSLEVGKVHYDLGNDLFQAMLDKRMNYTCGYWKNATNLDDAQLAKLELVCQKLMLKPGMRVLDIGCGFGALAKYAAENYGVNVVGVTISQEQCEYAKKNCSNLPVEIRFQDYRDINEKFDRVVSLGMFEHVGHLNYPTYMKTVRQNLKDDDSIFLLHTIGNNISYVASDEWITKYIFPNGIIPSISQIAKATEGLFVMEDWHNFGADYDKTLMGWYANFENSWSSLNKKYDQRFYRMWRYYLLSCAATFRSRANQLWQIVFTKEGIKGGYQAPRLDMKVKNNEINVKLNSLIQA